MKVIAKPVGCGKTKEVVQMALETGATIVCKDVKKMAKKIRGYGYGGQGIKIVDFYDFLGGDIHDQFVIDNAEEVLEILGDVIGISVSTDA